MCGNEGNCVLGGRCYSVLAYLLARLSYNMETRVFRGYKGYKPIPWSK